MFLTTPRNFLRFFLFMTGDLAADGTSDGEEWTEVALVISGFIPNCKSLHGLRKQIVGIRFIKSSSALLFSSAICCWSLCFSSSSCWICTRSSPSAIHQEQVTDRLGLLGHGDSLPACGQPTPGPGVTVEGQGQSRSRSARDSWTGPAGRAS